MTRQLALAKLLKEEGDNLTINEIKFIKDALKFYGDDDIDDVNWSEHLMNIIEMYAYVLEFDKK